MSQLSTSKLECRAAEGAVAVGQNRLLLDSHGRCFQKGLWQTEKSRISQGPSVCPYPQ